jgi:hypothetical protein
MIQSALKMSATLLLMVALILVSYPYQHAVAKSDDPIALTPIHWVHDNEAEDFIIYADDNGNPTCRVATTDNERFLASGNTGVELHTISSPIREQGPNGLTITLRSTSQLDTFPDAKAAFLRAAAFWESVIQTPISLVVDVDFGPKRFGQDFPSNVLGSTSTQSLLASNSYTTVRSALLSRATNAQEQAVYNALPGTQMPSDFGATADVVATSAVLRALGLIAANADPAGEQAQYGAPPAIGFNSAFNFDFDPSDGIAQGKIDFDAVAVHEIGHALGFTTQAGNQPSSGTARTGIWDFFRFAPGITQQNFTTTQRSFGAGGAPVFYSGIPGSPELGLSTGSSSAGGDGNQTSHWKADELTGTYIGIMDPTLPTGRRFQVTDNDKAVLDIMGYTFAPPSGGGGNGTAPSTSQFAARLDGDILTLTGVAIDPDGDIKQGQIALLDKSDSVLGTSQVFDVNFGTSLQVNFNLRFTNLSGSPTATQVRLNLFDARNNISAPVTADFSQADDGGSTIKKGSFDGEVVVLKGSGFVTEGTDIEVNGVIVAPQKIKAKGSGAKLLITGSATVLNLHSGANRVRARTNGKFSNILVLNN